MQSVVRSTLVLGVFALAGLTACGDKIVSGGGNGVDSVVHSVTVSPASVTGMKIGDKVTLAASVDAGAGVTDRTVQWSSSNTAVVTVDPTGVVTAIGGGTASVIAKATANPAVSGAAAITVGANVPATVTISTINQGGVPATLSNIAGQLDVTLNVDPGSQTISEVDLIMNCGGADTVVARQTLAAGNVAPAVLDSLAKGNASPVTLSFNTAAFNATTGVIAFKNGACNLKAKAITSAGTQVASSQTAITLNNVDGVIVTTTNSGNSASDANGLTWKSGNITVAALPVLYSGRTPANVTITLPGGNLASITGPASTTGTTSVTWSASSGNSPSIKGLTLFNGVDANNFQRPVHPNVLIVDSNGNDLNLNQLNPTAQSDVRIDNQAPPVAGVVFNPNLQNTQNGWLGAAYVFSTASDASKPITLPAATTTDNSGVDKVAITTQWAAKGTDPTQNTGWTTFTAVTSLAETSNSQSYDLRVIVCDALNNCTTTGTLTTFGVDLTPPSVTLTGGIADKNVYGVGATLPSTISFAVVDTSKTSGISGSGVGSTGLLVQDQGLKPDSSAATGSRTVCAIGTATGSGNAKTCKSPTAQTPSFVLPAAAVTAGEYTMVVTAVDQAGNTAPAQTITYYIDQNSPVVPAAGVTIPNPIGTGSSFSLAANDSMDVKAGNGFLAYGVANIFESGTAAPAGVTFDNVLTRQSTISVALSVFYRSMQAATGGTNPGTVGNLPAGLGVRAIDAANNLSTNQPVIFPAANVGTPVAISATDPANGLATFAIDSIVKNPVVTGHAVTVFVSGLSATATSGNPFVQVCLFYQEPTGAEGGAAGPDGAKAGELIKIGCSGAGATTGSGATRGFSYTLAWTPPAFFDGVALTSATLRAIGNTSGLDALITDGKVLTINPAP
jgi:hypothetical protein